MNGSVDFMGCDVPQGQLIVDVLCFATLWSWWKALSVFLEEDKNSVTIQRVQRKFA